jgi:UDP-N-acetylglucosamine 1-carboxyvinyltransferase
MKEQLIIQGGQKLTGEIKVSGSKNAALPIIAASILTNKPVGLTNVPHLEDVSNMLNLLLDLGVNIELLGHGSLDHAMGNSLMIDTNKITNLQVTSNIAGQMRASILLLGPLLAKFSKAKILLPGGCAIGARPVDLHLTALEALGAEFTINDNIITASTASTGLIGAEITLPKISVGATENILMAACLATGQTIIHNAAIEPEIIDLMSFLNNIGADISLKERSFTINGKKILEPNNTEQYHHHISADRIEAGSYAVAALATKGNITLTGVRIDILDPIKEYLCQYGAEITYKNNSLTICYKEQPASNYHIATAPYPNFPTDMQAQLAVLFTRKSGQAIIEENIFENRFMHVKELNKMNANMKILDNKLLIEGPSNLMATEVKASDLRASMALIIAALIAKGNTVINNIFHLDRGYENIEEKLSKCGIVIYRRKIHADVAELVDAQR